MTLKLSALLALALLTGGTEARRYGAQASSGRNRAHAVSHFKGPQTYTNVSGHLVHRPITASSRPRGATAECGDGSWSFSEHHRGTCSHHGGVASW